MNFLATGVISGIGAGDSVAIIEILWKTSSGEAVADAQAAGRGQLWTTAADSTALNSILAAAGITTHANVTRQYTTANLQATFPTGLSVTTANMTWGATYYPSIRITELKQGGGYQAGTWYTGTATAAGISLTFSEGTLDTTNTWQVGATRDNGAPAYPSSFSASIDTGALLLTVTALDASYSYGVAALYKTVKVQLPVAAGSCSAAADLILPAGVNIDTVLKMVEFGMAPTIKTPPWAHTPAAVTNAWRIVGYNNTIALFDDAGAVTTGQTFSAGNTYRLEFVFTYVSSGTYTVDCKVNGTTVLTKSNSTYFTGTQYYMFFNFLTNSTSAQSVRWDNVVAG